MATEIKRLEPDDELSAALQGLDIALRSLENQLSSGAPLVQVQECLEILLLHRLKVEMKLGFMIRVLKNPSTKQKCAAFMKAVKDFLNSRNEILDDTYESDDVEEQTGIFVRSLIYGWDDIFIPFVEFLNARNCYHEGAFVTLPDHVDLVSYKVQKLMQPSARSSETIERSETLEVDRHVPEESPMSRSDENSSMEYSVVLKPVRRNKKPHHDSASSSHVEAIGEEEENKIEGDGDDEVKQHATDEPTPNDDEPTPNDDEPIPNDDDEPTPNDDEPTPNDDDEPTPNDDEPTPNDDEPTPNDDEPTPNDDDNDEPTPNDDDTDEHTPNDGDNDATPDDDDNDEPTTNDDDNDEPTPDDDEPTPNDDEPTPNDDEPTSNDDEPTPNDDEPTSNDDGPIRNADDASSVHGDETAPSASNDVGTIQEKNETMNINEDQDSSESTNPLPEPSRDSLLSRSESLESSEPSATSEFTSAESLSSEIKSLIDPVRPQISRLNSVESPDPDPIPSFSMFTGRSKPCVDLTQTALVLASPSEFDQKVEGYRHAWQVEMRPKKSWIWSKHLPKDSELSHWMNEDKSKLSGVGEIKSYEGTEFCTDWFVDEDSFGQGVGAWQYFSDWNDSSTFSNSSYGYDRDEPLYRRRKWSRGWRRVQTQFEQLSFTYTPHPRVPQRPLEPQFGEEVANRVKSWFSFITEPPRRRVEKPDTEDEDIHIEWPPSPVPISQLEKKFISLPSFTTLPQAVEQQDNFCWHCHSIMNQTESRDRVVQSAFLCNYTYKAICRRCVFPRKMIIPCRVVNLADFRPYLVSFSGARAIKAVIKKPALTIDMVKAFFSTDNPTIEGQDFTRTDIEYREKFLSQLDEIKQDREQLVEAFHQAGEEVKSKVLRHVASRPYLVQSVEMFSIADLRDVNNELRNNASDSGIKALLKTSRELLNIPLQAT